MHILSRYIAAGSFTLICFEDKTESSIRMWFRRFYA